MSTPAMPTTYQPLRNPGPELIYACGDYAVVRWTGLYYGALFDAYAAHYQGCLVHESTWLSDALEATYLTPEQATDALLGEYLAPVW